VGWAGEGGGLVELAGGGWRPGGERVVGYGERPGQQAG
jgi:hypothetical protein